MIRSNYEGEEMEKALQLEISNTRMINQSVWYMYQTLEKSNRARVEKYNAMKIKFINEKELLTFEGRQKELALLAEVLN